MQPGAFGLGIDFGTSNTVAVLRWPDARVKPLLFEGSPLLPSAVFAPAEGPLVVGSDALHYGRFEPAGLEPNPKRRIDDDAVLLGTREVTVVDLVAAVLRHVVTETLRVTGGVLPATALAHPAGWGPVRRTVLTEAAVAAGLGDVRLVPEPVAAANYFTGVLNRDIAVGQALVIYDLGAGTFDASVVRRGPAGYQVVAVDGLDDVGGLDVDAVIVDWIRDGYGPRQPEVWSRLTNPTSADDQRQRRMLWDDVRVAKEMLSRAPAVLMRLPMIDDDVQLTRDEFEAAAQPLLARTIRTTNGLIRYSHLAPQDLAGLFLVGGSSRIPLAATLLHRVLDIAPTATEQPELIVGEGVLQAVPHTPPATAPAAQDPVPTPGPAGPAPAPGTGAVPPLAPTSGPPAWAPTSGAPVAAPTSGAPAWAPTSGAPIPAPTSGAPAWAPTSGAPVPAPTSGAPVPGSTGAHPLVPASGAVGVPPQPAVPPVPAVPAAPAGPQRLRPAASATGDTGTIYFHGRVPEATPGRPSPARPRPVQESRVIPLWTTYPQDEPAAPAAGATPPPRPPRPRNSVASIVLITLLVFAIAGGMTWVIIQARQGGNTNTANPGPSVTASSEDSTPTSAPTSTADAPVVNNNGPAAAGGCSPCYVTVPNVINKTRDDAAATLRRAGLRVGDPQYRTVSCRKPDYVLETRPAAGERVEQGTLVTLYLPDPHNLGTCPSASTSATTAGTGSGTPSPRR